MCSPYNKNQILLIESVQHLATKYILSDYEINYKHRLVECNLVPSTYRRVFLDVGFICNALNNCNDFEVHKMFTEYTNHALRSGVTGELNSNFTPKT